MAQNKHRFFSSTVAALVAIFATLAPVGASAQAKLDADPYTVLKTSSDELLKAIQQDKARLKSTPGAVYELLTDKVKPTLDIPYMTALILGRHYRKSNDEQRDAFAEAFSQQMIRRYADALLEYGGESVSYTPVKPEPGEDKVKVKSTIIPESGVAVPLLYSMRQNSKDQRWRIYDVTIDGISMVTNYRTQFDSQIRRKGLDNVIADLKAGR